MSDELTVTVDGILFAQAVLHPLIGAFLAPQRRVMVLDEDTTVGASHGYVAALLDAPTERFVTYAEDVRTARAALGVETASALVMHPAGKVTYLVNEDLPLKESTPHTAQVLGSLPRQQGRMEAHQAS